MAENIKESAHLKKRNKSQEHEQKSESSGSSRDVLVEELSDIDDRFLELQVFNEYPEFQLVEQ